MSGVRVPPPLFVVGSRSHDGPRDRIRLATIGQARDDRDELLASVARFASLMDVDGTDSTESGVEEKSAVAMTV